MDHAAVVQLIAAYGYLAVFAGTLLEGETILVAAGFAAQQGLLDWRLVLATAMLGGILGDQLAFLAGRLAGPRLFARFPALERRAPRVLALLRRYDAVCIVALRFLYGLRIAGPAILGASGVAPRRFTRFNALGAALWAPLVGGLGYASGLALEALLGDLREMQAILLAAILAGGLLLWLWRRHRRREQTGP